MARPPCPRARPDPRAKPRAKPPCYHEGKRTKEGFRIIFVHSSSKQKEDEARRERKIQNAIVKLEEILPKLNAYHLNWRGGKVSDHRWEIFKWPSGV